MPTCGVWRQASTSRAAGVWLQAVIAPRMCGNTAKTMCCRWCVQDASCVSTAHVSKRVPFTPVCCHIQKSVSTHAHVDLKGRVSTKGLCLQDEPRCVELHILGSRRSSRPADSVLAAAGRTTGHRSKDQGALLVPERESALVLGIIRRL